jgi:hypothetical protein
LGRVHVHRLGAGILVALEAHQDGRKAVGLRPRGGERRAFGGRVFEDESGLEVVFDLELLESILWIHFGRNLRKKLENGQL